MNAQNAQDPYRFWRAAIATGKPIETERGSPRAGYFRQKDEAVAFVLNEDGTMYAWRSGPFPSPTHADAIDELFGFCAPHPISYEDFEFFNENKRWPDQIAPVEVAADLSPHERADAELTAQREAMAKWIAEIKTIATQEHATKAGNFADEFAKIEKESEAKRKAEKKPFDDSSDAVQAKWAPIVKRAADLKVYAKKSVEGFLIAEKARIKAEADALAFAAAKYAREAEEARRQAEATGAPPPVEVAPQTFAPPPVKAKAGKVHLRTVTIHTIVDRRSFLEFLANMNNLPQDLLDVMQIIANRMRSAGVEVPGVETKTEERAS